MKKIFPNLFCRKQYQYRYSSGASGFDHLCGFVHSSQALSDVRYSLNQHEIEAVFFIDVERKIRAFNLELKQTIEFILHVLLVDMAKYSLTEK